ncbi:unnamed protein product [Dimorphilus gyrociliatus]|uniref:Uncharacterized protein n=1 Tax=Dimorphilus gyrociliatus TaxID=2664684 RepID=A0A7I8WES1_9ANNE|nr:unnamed protein product [Dimorphilus gyrociliatus]
MSVVIGNLIKNSCRIQCLNISENSNIENGLIHIITKLERSHDTLREIDLTNCNLNKSMCKLIIDTLRNFSTLENVYLGENTNIGMHFSDICKGLKTSCKTLITISLYNCGLCGEYGEELKNLFTLCPQIQQINIGHNDTIANENLKLFKGLQCSSYTLKIIRITEFKLDEDASNHLGNLLLDCHHIEELDLEGNTNMRKGFFAICNGLQNSCSKLKFLYLEECNLNENMGLSLAQLLVNCTQLQACQLKSNKDLVEAIISICGGLETSSDTLKTLDFADCNLDENSSISLGNLLLKCSTVEKVHLNCNRNMGRQGFSSICKGLVKSSTSLKGLYFDECCIDEFLCICIGDLLTKCSKIEKTYFRSNPSMINGVYIIFKELYAFRANLTAIDFENCNITKYVAFYIGDFLSKSTRICTIFIGLNRDMGDGFFQICKGLENSVHTLKNIGFQNCKLNENMCKSVGKLLTKCSKIEKLYIGWNSDIGRGWRDICRGLERSSKNLQIFDIRHSLLDSHSCQTISRHFGKDIARV